jgi:hypothetical protein
MAAILAWGSLSGHSGANHFFIQEAGSIVAAELQTRILGNIVLSDNARGIDNCQPCIGLGDVTLIV